LLGAVLDPLTAFVTADPYRNWPIVLERYGKLSMRTYLETQTLYSPGAIEMIEVLLNFESRANLAFVQNLIERALINSENKYFEIEGGMDRLPRAFLPGLATKGVAIAFNQRLVRLTQLDGKVQLGFEWNDPDFGGVPDAPGALLSHGFVPEVEADVAILTVPFTGLRFVDTTPLFSQGKRRAIREMAWDAATKVFLQFSERFWETRDGIYGGYTTTDRPNRFLYYPSHGLGDPGGGVLLASYTWADEARGWDALTPDQRVRYALDQVAAIHGEYVRGLFVTGTSHSWAQDDFSLGEAAMFQPGQMADLQRAVAAPEGLVHFAGDHTTLRHAWIEGAIESGLRVALEVSEGVTLGAVQTQAKEAMA
jgi:monoamine oxidase